MPLRAPGASGSTPIRNARGQISWIRQEGSIRTPIIDLVRQSIPGWVGTRGTRFPVGIYKPQVSVGNQKVPVSIQGPRLPPVYSGDPAQPAAAGIPLPDATDRRDQAPIQSELPVQIEEEIAGRIYKATPEFLRQLALEQNDQAALKRIEALIIARTGDLPPTPTFIPVTKDKSKPMDLGALITDLGTTYIKTKYAPVPTVQQQPVYSLPELGGDIVDFFTEPTTGEIVPVRKKKPCRRRRRRRLATKSDLGDLAALKAILGNGEAFKAWIATHSR